jgi:hypothetical protein
METRKNSQKKKKIIFEAFSIGTLVGKSPMPLN